MRPAPKTSAAGGSAHAPRLRPGPPGERGAGEPLSLSGPSGAQPAGPPERGWGRTRPYVLRLSLGPESSMAPHWHGKHLLLSVHIEIRHSFAALTPRVLKKMAVAQPLTVLLEVRGLHAPCAYAHPHTSAHTHTHVRTRTYHTRERAHSYSRLVQHSPRGEAIAAPAGR